MTLPIIRSGGIEAYCSDLVIDENTWAYLLSVAGYQTAVKGIIATVLEYQTVTVSLNGGCSRFFCLHLYLFWLILIRIYYVVVIYTSSYISESKKINKYLSSLKYINLAFAKIQEKI